MYRLTSFFVAVTVIPWGSALAQPQRLQLPRTSNLAPTPLGPLANYGNNRQEAALAAFQAGYKAATTEHNRDRATRFMLIALRRDPTLDRALYDIAILCEGYGRWHDALKFMEEAQQRTEPDSDVAKLARGEIERIKLIARLEDTPEGAKRRAYDIQLLSATTTKDQIRALDASQALTKRDAGRWEGFALAGVLHAEMGAYPESLKDLESAMRLAPGPKRMSLQTAIEIARREANFSNQLREAEGLWAKQLYERAAAAYSEAWENSPGHMTVGMRAATAYLLADQVPLAVQILLRLRPAAAPDLAARITAMLRELGALSEEAKNEAMQTETSAQALPVDPAQRIKSQIGSVITHEIELAGRSDPSLIDTPKRVISVPDEELTRGQNDIGIISSVSIFAIYRQDAEASGLPAPVSDSAVHQVAPAAQPEAPVAVLPATDPPRRGTPFPRLGPRFADPEQARPTETATGLSTDAPSRMKPPSGPVTAQANVSPVNPVPVNSAPANPVPADPAPPNAAPAMPAPAPPPASARSTADGGRPARGSPQNVDVTSRPNGAVIVFDDIAGASSPLTTCTTPCTVTLTPGRHSLRAGLAGYKEAHRIFEVSRKSPPVLVDLDAKRGNVSIESSPAGLPIFVNSKGSGKNTPATLVLDEGEYEIRVGTGDDSLVKKVSVRDGAMLRVRFGDQ